jgi:cysteinyl-tRNA synthetase
MVARTAASLAGFTLSINDAGVLFVGNLTSAEFNEMGTQEITEDRIKSLIEIRKAARKAKNFEEGDRVRKYLAERNIALKDTKNKETGEIETTWEVAR